MVYLFVVSLLLVLIIRYDIKEKKRYADFCYKAALFVFVLIAGLRYRIGGDTIYYLNEYNRTCLSLSDISFDYLLDSTSPLFYLLLSVFKQIGTKFFVFQLFHACVVNVLIFNYIKRHTPYCFTCILFYFIWMYPYYNFEEMKASMGLVFCLYANDYCLDRKWFKALLLYTTGVLFHFSAIVLLLMPLFMFVKLNRMGTVLLFLFFVCGYVVQKVFSDYLFLFEFNDVLSTKTANYSSEDIYFTQQLALRGIILKKMTWLFYAYLAVIFLRRRDSKELLRVEPFVFISLGFILMTIPLPIMYRFVHFTAIYLLLYCSFLFVELIKNSQKICKSVSLIRTIVIFIPFAYNVQNEWSSPIFESTKTNKYYAYEKYYPYSSILDKSISQKRERLLKVNQNNYCYPNSNEY